MVTRRQWGYAALMTPLPLLLLLVYFLPFLGVMSWSFTQPQVGLDQYRAVFSDPLVLGVLARTFRICAIVTILAVSAAYLLAYVWVQGSRTTRVVVEFCILVPLWISALVRAFGWLIVLYNRGIANEWLMDLGIIDQPLALVRNELGVVIGMTHYCIPFAVFPLASSMRQVDRRVLLAARSIGAGRIRTFWSVFLPMTAPGVYGAAVITFIFGLGFFITPAILGGGRSVMVAEFVYVQLFQTVNWGLAAAISVLLVAFVALLLAALFRVARIDKLVG